MNYRWKWSSGKSVFAFCGCFKSISVENPGSCSCKFLLGNQRIDPFSMEGLDQVSGLSERILWVGYRFLFGNVSFKVFSWSISQHLTPRSLVTGGKLWRELCCSLRKGSKARCAELPLSRQRKNHTEPCSNGISPCFSLMSMNLYSGPFSALGLTLESVILLCFVWQDSCTLI